MSGIQASGAELSGMTIGGQILESFGDLILDWDAAVFTTIVNVSGTDRVRRWVDKKAGISVNGLSGDNTSWPTYVASYHNSLPAVQFDGTNDTLRGRRETRLQNISRITMISVGLNSVFGHTGSVAQRTVLSGDSTANTLAGVVAAGSNTNGLMSSGADVTSSIKVMVFDGTQTGNANRLKVYRNKSQLTLSFSGTIPAATENFITSQLLMGDASKTGTYRSGYLMRVIIFRNTAMSLSEVEDVSDLLNETYEIY